MRTRVLLPAALLAAAAITLACSSDDGPTGPETIRYTASLNAANEVNAQGASLNVQSPATGTAEVTITGSTMTWTVNVGGAGLVANASASHIHAGASNSSGPVVFDFFPAGGATVPAAFRTGTLVTGTVDLGAATIPNLRAGVTVDSLRRLLETGSAYVNVHSQTYAGGEIRGQLARQAR
jgi:hypothetical protein